MWPPGRRETWPRTALIIILHSLNLVLAPLLVLTSWCLVLVLGCHHDGSPSTIMMVLGSHCYGAGGAIMIVLGEPLLWCWGGHDDGAGGDITVRSAGEDGRRRGERQVWWRLESRYCSQSHNGGGERPLLATTTPPPPVPTLTLAPGDGAAGGGGKWRRTAVLPLVA